MSMNTCFKCGEVYDTDFQMEVDKDGNMICDICKNKITLNDEEFYIYTEKKVNIKRKWWSFGNCYGEAISDVCIRCMQEVGRIVNERRDKDA